MNFPARNQLDPAPFREWCEQRLTPSAVRAREGIGEFAGLLSVEQLASDLGLSERRLHAWRFENRSLERHSVEDALHLAGFALWEVYPDLELSGEEVGGPKHPGPPIGFGSKVSDRQVRVLHRLHIERELSIRELGRRLYKQLGYVSADAAVFGIRGGFRRLGLEATWRHPSVLDTTVRCSELKTNGEPCEALPMRGEKVCWPHHPDNREEAARRVRSLRPHDRTVAA